MTLAPQVSVVMSVCNGAATLKESVHGVLSQNGVDIEFIIVNDGSTDASAAMLDDFANADGRIRVIHQHHRGLTLALMHGCSLARGQFIARQDCGDRSLPGRLRAELQVIESCPDAALVSCGTRFVGPEGEILYEVSTGTRDATAELLALDLEKVRGPSHHGSTLFRRDLYERVGGYRPQFYYAQDLDLWTRLAERGRHVAIPDVHYEASFAPGSISALQRRSQVDLLKLILECARLRRAGLSEADVLAQASAILPGKRKPRASDVAAALYFMGACLRERRDPRARRYFLDALRAYPLHAKSAARLLLG
jgi:glycosyltransferase involved in cell wall biosynthesis